MAYITAGAGGMYCGSCMHDNTLAGALAKLDVDVQLIPLYTPIRTDEHDVSVDRVFFGGINVYLQQKIPLFRYLPNLFDRFLDQPRLLRWATSGVGETSPKELGGLAVSMLRGASGFQRKEVRKLCSWLGHSARPHVVNLSNMLIAGCVPAMQETLGVPILVTLQGDDIFLDELIEPFKAQAFDEIRKLVEYVDGFIVNSRFYADYMADYFAIPPHKFHVVPLGIDTTDFRSFQEMDRSNKTDRPPTIGYLARLAPEKGLHILADAFIELRSRAGTQDVRLRIAGWLGDKNREYAEGEFQKLRAAGLESAFEYVGEVDRRAKIDFLSQIDILSVPSVYRDPKGLYILEALAAGVPVVQPDHGAFPELIDRTRGGRLVEPNSAIALADGLHTLLTDDQLRNELGRQGRQSVHENFNATKMAESVLQVFHRLTNRAV